MNLKDLKHVSVYTIYTSFDCQESEEKVYMTLI